MTPANSHSQTGLAQKAGRLSGPSYSKRGQSHFCVKLGNYRQVCSLSSRPTNDMLSIHGRPQPGSFPRCVSRVCSCELVTVCLYVCVTSVARITMSVTHARFLCV